MELKERTSLLLFDGNALIHRAFHALPPMTVPRTGEMVNAVYGFTSTLLKALRELEATYCAAAFDYPAPTFRKKKFEEYKAQRPRTPPELISQIILSHQIAAAFRIPVFEMNGFEADDILGTLSRQARAQGVETIIVTGDNDMLQLVSPEVKVYTPGRKFDDAVLYDSEGVKRKWGVGPEAIPDLKALTGDASDNIPGVFGIGQKTAARLLQQFGTVEEVYARIEEITPQRLQATLLQYKEQVSLGKELTTIVRNVPISLDLEECRVSDYDHAGVLKLFQKLEFTRLLSRLPQSSDELEPHRSSLPISPGEKNAVEDEMALQKALASINAAKEFVIDVELTDGDVRGLTLSPIRGKSFYIPLELDKFSFHRISLPEVAAGLKPALEDSLKSKISCDAKQLLSLLTGQGIELKNLCFDVTVAAHLLGEKKLSLDALAFNKLGLELKPRGKPKGKSRQQKDSLSVDEAAEYAAAGASVVWDLKSKLEQEVHQQGLEKVFYEMELPLIQILVDMERNGVALDIHLLRELSLSLQSEITGLEAMIYNSVGHRFNINSPRQLGEVLFQDLKLPSGRKTKTGYSTEARILESLRDVHPAVNFVLQYRQLSKLKSTYVDALPTLADKMTGRVHTTLSQVGTATGRISSSEPNLQNIPIRTEQGNKIRQAFIASPGNVLLSADYSQIDLRVLAHLSQDEGLIAAFVNDEDIHTTTASRLFNVTAGQVTPEMRRNAKTVNFGVIYGMSDYGLEQATSFTRSEASQFISLYFERYPRVKEYLEKIKKQARKLGYVQTLEGRRRFLPEINSPNRLVREAAERMAINAPVQGTSADIIKIAMINLHMEMKRRELRSKMLLQIHDELLFEIPREEIETIRSLVQEIMPGAVKLCVPLKISLKLGKNWGEMS